MKALILPIFLLLGYCISTSAQAEVTVKFNQPENYTDFMIGGSSSPRIVADLTKQVDKYLKDLDAEYLPKGDTLEIVFKDIDMAGGFEPWRRTEMMQWTRIISDVYPPKLSVHYVWKDPSGQVKADREELLTELNYRILTGYRDFRTYDPLRYEKVLLRRWFLRTFGGDAGKPLLEK